MFTDLLYARSHAARAGSGLRFPAALSTPGGRHSHRSLPTPGPWQAGKDSSTTVPSLRTGRGEGLAKEDGENDQEWKGWRHEGKKEETKEKFSQPSRKTTSGASKNKYTHLGFNTHKNTGFRSSQTGHKTNTPTHLKNETDTVEVYRNIFYLGNTSQNSQLVK